MPRGKSSATLELVEAARAILETDFPMTLRQVFYQLVSSQTIENTEAQYNRLGRVLVDARKEGAILWDWMEDRTRRPRGVSMWRDLADFGDTAARAYRLNVWNAQAKYFEAWLEKDALSGLFETVLEPYGVTLNVGRGFDSWDSIRNAAGRLADGDTVLYFGDFDPSGVDMPRSLKERLGFFDRYPDVKICALTREDIDYYNLPPAPAKRSDTRSAAFIERHGDRAVELDALPGRVLRQRLVDEVEGLMDMDALRRTREADKVDRQKLVEALAGL